MTDKTTEQTAAEDAKRPVDVLVSCCIDLIDTLTSSCTEYASATGIGDEHEHNLFDDVDKGRLDEIRSRLFKLQESMKDVCN